MFVSPVGSVGGGGIPEEWIKRLNKQLRHKRYWKELGIDEKDIEKYLMSGFKNFQWKKHNPLKKKHRKQTINHLYL